MVYILAHQLDDKVEIAENFLIFGSAKEIWDATNETYSKGDNLSELFTVQSTLHDLS